MEQEQHVTQGERWQPPSDIHQTSYKNSTCQRVRGRLQRGTNA